MKINLETSRNSLTELQIMHLFKHYNATSSIEIADATLNPDLHDDVLFETYEFEVDDDQVDFILTHLEYLAYNSDIRMTKDGVVVTYQG